MSRNELAGFRVAVIAGDGTEEAELAAPVEALRNAGATVRVLSPTGSAVQTHRGAEKGRVVPAGGTMDEIEYAAFDAVLLPGGPVNADRLRSDARLQRFLKKMDQDGRIVAASSCAQWALISAGLVRDRALSGSPSLRDDVVEAGGRWRNEPAVRDGNLVTGRGLDDVAAFVDKLLLACREHHRRAEQRRHEATPVEERISGGSHPGVTERIDSVIE